MGDDAKGDDISVMGAIIPSQIRRPKAVLFALRNWFRPQLDVHHGFWGDRHFSALPLLPFTLHVTPDR